MKMKWKDIYNDNKNRRYCEITGIKKEDVEIESNSFRILKEKKYCAVVVILIITLILLYTFRKDLKVFFMVMAFFIIAGICFFVFNYFKFKCMKDGLYIRFGMQQGKFAYEKVKSIYLSKFNDYSFLIPSRAYNIVIRYTDNNNRIKELSFPNYFLDKQETIDFLENFEIKEVQNESYVNFEKFKILKKIAKAGAVVLFLVVLFVMAFAGK